METVIGSHGISEAQKESEPLFSGLQMKSSVSFLSQLHAVQPV